MLNWTQEEKGKYIHVLPTDVAVSTSNERTLTLSFSNGDVLTNDDIIQETLSIDKAFCEDEEFHIGNVGSASFSIQIINNGTSHKDMTCDVTMTCDGKSVALGHYTIVDDVLSDNRIRRTLKGYDDAYNIREADVTAWYDSLYSVVEERHTIKEIRDSFFQHFGITQEVVTLPNDNLSTRKTLDTSNVIKGSTILNAICEINAVFGSFNGSGVFTYKSIDRTTNTDYDEVINGGTAIGEPLTYKDFEVEPATKVKVTVDDDNIGGVVGTGNNMYAVAGNVFTYDSQSSELTAAATNILNEVSKITFTPMTITIPFMPWLELGDWLKLLGKDILGNDIEIYAPILTYSLSGIQGAKLNLSADGMQFYPVRTQTPNEQIIALRKKSAKIIQEIGEISSLLEEQGIYPLFYPALATDDDVKYPNPNLHPTLDLKYNLENEIQQIVDNAEAQIMARVSLELENYDTHEASLQLWVGRQENDQIVSMINASADVIELNSDRFILNSTNLQISADGNITAVSGDIGGWSVGEKGLYNNDNKIGIINTGSGGFVYGGLEYDEAIENFQDGQWRPSTLLLTNDGRMYGSSLSISYRGNTALTAEPLYDRVTLDGDISFNSRCYIDEQSVAMFAGTDGLARFGIIHSNGDYNGMAVSQTGGDDRISFTTGIEVHGYVDAYKVRLTSASNFEVNNAWSGTITIGSVTMTFENGLLINA